MANKQAFTCDVCGIERKEANHWFVSLSGFVSEDESMPLVAFAKWDALSEITARAEDDKSVKVGHICGQVCAQKLLNEFLSK